MSDLIDRQAVIDLLKQMRKDGDMVPWEGKDVFARIRKLPTIQPEKAQLSQEGTTSDLISRQAVLDIFDDYNIAVENGELEAYSRDRKRLCNLPTIQPQSTVGQLNDSAQSTDLIDRQQAIDGKIVIQRTNGVEIYYDEAVPVGYLKNLPTVQPEPQWIPVGEKLPETEDFVLASLSGKYRNTTSEHACEIADYADGEWCVYAYPNMSAEKCAELIEAWMPLPTPYRKGAAT